MHVLHAPRSGSPAVLVVAGAFGATTPWLLDLPWTVRSLLAAALVAASATAAIDARTGRLPDRLVALCGGVAAAMVASESLAGRGPAALTGAVLGAVAFAAPLLAVHVAVPSAMGFGDVKFAAALGSALGVVDPAVSIVALALACAVTVVAAALLRRGALPFGPGLALGAALALVPFALLRTGAGPWQ